MRMSWQNCCPRPPCPLVAPVWGARAAEIARIGTPHIHASRSGTNRLPKQNKKNGLTFHMLL